MAITAWMATTAWTARTAWTAGTAWTARTAWMATTPDAGKLEQRLAEMHAKLDQRLAEMNARLGANWLRSAPVICNFSPRLTRFPPRPRGVAKHAAQDQAVSQ